MSGPAPKPASGEPKASRYINCLSCHELEIWVLRKLMDLLARMQAATAAPAEASKPAVADPKAFGWKTRGAKTMFKDLDAHSSLQTWACRFVSQSSGEYGNWFQHHAVIW